MSYSISTPCWNCKKNVACSDSLKLSEGINEMYDPSNKGHLGSGQITLMCSNMVTKTTRTDDYLWNGEPKPGYYTEIAPLPSNGNVVGTLVDVPTYKSSASQIIEDKPVRKSAISEFLMSTDSQVMQGSIPEDEAENAENAEGYYEESVSRNRACKDCDNTCLGDCPIR